MCRSDSDSESNQLMWRTHSFLRLNIRQANSLFSSSYFPVSSLLAPGSSCCISFRSYPVSTVPSAARPLKPTPARRFRALDLGAGVGRVTSDTLLPLVSDVVLLEPVESLIRHTETRAGGR